MKKAEEQSTEPKPVAYTPEGEPLYTHPPTNSPVESGENPQVVYLSRAIEPHQQDISPEVKRKHEESIRRYPHLNLSEGEFVISAIRRHPIGVLSIWVIVILAVLMVIAIPAILVSSGMVPFQFTAGTAINGSLVLILVIVLLILAGVVATAVYEANRFYLTNESVTQYIQTSLFSRKDQTISLANIEDASYRQKGIVQTVLNYGSIRLSTEGEETTYRFMFVSDPERQIKLLNDAVEAFKNFRPVDPDEN